MESITKKELKDIKSLRSKKGRRTLGLFLAEGVRLLEEAVRHDVRPQLLLCAPSLLTARGRELATRFGRHRVRTVELSARALDAVSDSVTSQGIMGVFDLPKAPSHKLLSADSRTVLLCDGIRDPGNLGTLTRCALAFRFNPVFLTGRCADPFAPKVVRASVGAVFGLDLVTVTASEVVTMAEKGKFRLIAADTNGRDADSEFSSKNPDRLMLAIGSEADGLSEPILKAAQWRWRLNHEPCVESLNAAVAAAIMMKQIYDLTTGKPC